MAEIAKKRQKKKAMPSFALVYFMIDQTTCIVRKEKIKEQESVEAF